MFSSLNVIPDAEYTFSTRFQDHKYKVGETFTQLFDMYDHTGVIRMFSVSCDELLNSNLLSHFGWRWGRPSLNQSKPKCERKFESYTFGMHQ